MRILVDTNIFVRLANPADVQYECALESLALVRMLGYRPCIVPQILYEYWVVATRRAEQNGLGMSVSESESDITNMVEKFHLIRDERAIYDHWYQLVLRYKVIGKMAHDARLVAAMKRHDIAHLLTFNDRDFSRFTDIVAVNPASVTTLPPTK